MLKKFYYKFFGTNWRNNNALNILTGGGNVWHEYITDRKQKFEIAWKLLSKAKLK